MSASVLYTNFGGMIVKEDRGGVEKEYLPDTLGSTAVMIGSTGKVTDRFDYWPYGEIASRTGNTPTPFTWVGTLGYYKDSATRFYVRMRSYLANIGGWMTVDPLWPREKAYQYVDGKVNSQVDPIGLGTLVIGGGIVLTTAMLVFLAVLLGITIALLTYLLLYLLDKIRSWICGIIRRKMKDVCGDDTEGRYSDVCGGCDWDDSCSALLYKAFAYSACANLRMMEMMFCYSAPRRGASHVGQWLDATGLAIECEMMFLMKCAPFIGRVPRWPNRWTPPWSTLIR